MRFALSSCLTVGLVAVVPIGPPASAQSGGFVEVAAALGLDHRFMSGLDRIGELPVMHDWVQQGIANGDVDGDGDLDVALMGRLAPNHAYRHTGTGYADVSGFSGIQSADLDTCLAFADYDNDGDLDLVIGVYEHGSGTLPGRGRLYRNGGNGLFQDVTALTGFLGSGHTLAAVWFDVDLDGYDDLYLSEFGATPNQLWRNNGDGSLSEVGAAKGVDVGGSTHVSNVLDSDGDGFYEVFIGNDHFVTEAAELSPNVGDLFLHGQTGLTWLDETLGSGVEAEGTTMGITVGDVNYDGLPDVFKTEVAEQYLLVNQGWPTSGLPWLREEAAYGVELALMPDIQQPGQFGDTVGWGCAFFDADLDRWDDLFVACGHVQPTGVRFQQNFLMKGGGPDAAFAFSDFTAEYGLFEQVDDRALSVGDFDDDGDIDMMIGPPGGKVRLFRNEIDPEGRGYLSVRPIATTSAPSAAGTVVSWTDSEGFPHTRWIGSDAPTASQRENRAHFGLGFEASADVSVAFPSGVTLSFSGVPANSELTAVEPELVRLSATTAPTASNPPPPGTVLTPQILAALGFVRVTAFAHDAMGNGLDGSAVVTIDVPGLTALTPVLHVSGNEFRRYFRSAATPGEFRARVTMDGFQVRVERRSPSA